MIYILFVGAFVKEFNISITVVSPAFTKPLPIFHNEPIPQVVIVANGAGCDSANPTTHFSATSMYI